MPDSTRRLKITACSLVHQGVNSKQKSYSIYEVKATYPDGRPLPAAMKLRSFQELPVGQTLDLKIERFESEAHGVSYTLSAERGTNAGRVQALQDRVEALETTVKRLGERLTQLEGASTPPPSAPAGIPVLPGGDDIPFAPSTI